MGYSDSGGAGPGSGFGGGTGGRDGMGDRSDADNNGGSRWSQIAEQNRQKEAQAAAAKAAEEKALAAAQAQRNAAFQAALVKAKPPVEDISFTDEVKSRGLGSTLANHLAGMVPGVNVQAQDYYTGQPAPSITNFSGSRLAGDLVGMGLGVPGLGDLAHNAVGNKEIAMALSGGAVGGVDDDPGSFGGGGDSSLKLIQPTTISQTTTSVEDRTGLVAMLMGKRG